MCEAATEASCEPRDLSFVNTLKILRCRLPEVPRSPSGITTWYANLIAEVAEERIGAASRPDQPARHQKKDE